MADVTITPLLRLLLTVPDDVNSGSLFTFDSVINLTGMSYDTSLAGYTAVVEQQIQDDGTSDNTPVNASFSIPPTIQWDGATNLLEGVIQIPTLAPTISAIVLNIQVPIDFTFSGEPGDASLGVELSDVLLNPTGTAYQARLPVSSTRVVATPDTVDVLEQSNFPPEANASAQSVDPPSVNQTHARRDVIVDVPIEITPSNPTPTNPTYLGLWFTLQILFGPIGWPD